MRDTGGQTVQVSLDSAATIDREYVLLSSGMLYMVGSLVVLQCFYMPQHSQHAHTVHT